jgi:hypothetical protein
MSDRSPRSDQADLPPQEDKVGERLPPRSRTPTAPQAAQEDKLTETIRARLEHMVPELIKKTFAAGLGAVSSTEEGIRKIARDVNLPDVASYIASSADGARGKVWEVIARETREFLSNLNLTEEVAKILTTLSFEIKTEVRFIPNSERLIGSEPDVKATVRMKRQTAEKSEDPTAERDKSRLRFWRRDDSGSETPVDEAGPEEKPNTR